jgi:LuxR family maltose regulon positive regulatory protein
MRLRTQATWALPTFAVRLRLELARLLLGLSDPAGARALLREIDEILAHRPDLGALVRQVDHLRHQLVSLPAGKVGVSSLSPAELRLLPYLQTHLTHVEIGQRLYVSVNTVRTQTQSIYRKLDVSTRAAAVEQARTVGLLAH